MIEGVVLGAEEMRGREGDDSVEGVVLSAGEVRGCKIDDGVKSVVLGTGKVGGEGFDCVEGIHLESVSSHLELLLYLLYHHAHLSLSDEWTRVSPLMCPAR